MCQVKRNVSPYHVLAATQLLRGCMWIRGRSALTALSAEVLGRAVLDV